MSQEPGDKEPVYRVLGPVRAQDGREVWQVVRPIAFSCGMQAVLGEALNRESAQALADELNTVLAELEHGLKAGIA